MKNDIKTFTLVTRDDTNSKEISEKIRSTCTTLKEDDDGDLVIAVGGDGTFLKAVNTTGFSKKKVYAGIHTGTLGFLQELSESDIYAFIKYILYEKEISTRKVYISKIIIRLKNGSLVENNSLNEILIAGKNYTTISFDEYVNDEFLQTVSGNGIIIATNTGDTAYSMSSGGPIDFSNNLQLIATLESPIVNNVSRIVTNPIICSKISLKITKNKKNLIVVVDGIERKIKGEQIEAIEVIATENDYINKLQLTKYSKVDAVRKKILGD